MFTIFYNQWNKASVTLKT